MGLACDCVRAVNWSYANSSVAFHTGGLGDIKGDALSRTKAALSPSLRGVTSSLGRGIVLAERAVTVFCDVGVAKRVTRIELVSEACEGQHKNVNVIGHSSRSLEDRKIHQTSQWDLDLELCSYIQKDRSLQAKTDLQL